MMKDPRLGDLRIRSPAEKIRVVHRSEWHQDHHPADYVQERRPTIRTIRSLSPPELVERQGRVLDGYRRGTSIEREEYNRQFYDDRDDRTYSRSPPYGKSLKWSHMDEEYSFREGRPPRDIIEGGVKYTMQEYRDLYGDGNPNPPKHFSGSGPRSSRYGMPPQAVGPIVNSGRSGGSFPSSSTSGKLSILREEEELRFLNTLPSNKLSARGSSYTEEDKPLGDVYDPTLVSSHSKGVGSLPSGASKDNFLGYNQNSSHSDGFGRRQEKYSGYGGQDGYSEAPRSDLARNPGVYSNDLTSCHYDPLSSARREHGEYNYREHGRRVEGNSGYQSELYRQDQLNERRAYTGRDIIRPRLSGSDVDEVQYIEYSRKSFRESNSRAHNSLQGEPLSNYRDRKSNLLAAERDVEFVGSGTDNFRLEPSNDRERTYSGGDYGFGRDAGPLSHKERLKRSQMSESDPNTYRLDVSPRPRFKAEELSIHEPTERMHKRRYLIDEEMSGHIDRRISLSDRISSRQVQELSRSEEQWPNENPGGLFSSKRFRFSNPEYQKSGRPYEGRIASRISASDDWSSSRDVPGYVQRRVIDRFTTEDGNVNIKSRLRPCPPNYHDSYPMDRKQDFYKSERVWKRNPDNQYDDVLTDDGHPSEEMDAPLKPDLPEDSDEFKQLVENLFLEFSKRLNENPYTRRRYREQGNAGILLCVVCGRLSKEFLDTRSLVTHTFMSRKVGKRAHHLALNKAICVLMGWKSVIMPNGACIYEVLPETEALTLREDLILWPPLVIIHDSSVLRNSSDDREFVAIEHMEAILRGLGFSGGKMKLRYGRPANKSIIVVKFLPTFSGLQEAEKLHKYYLENTRGRGEFQKLKNSNNRNIVGEEAGIPEEKVEHVLYGYMGIAEDLDKLDFDTKKKSVVKSKKDILAIADAPVKSE